MAESPVPEALPDDRYAPTDLRIGGIEGATADDVDSEMGPLITKEHQERVLSCIDSGIEEGASILADGRGLLAD